jgi:hypothetical protein
MDAFVSTASGTNYMYKNAGGGLFEVVQPGPLAIDFADSHGAAWGDINGDGLLVRCMQYLNVYATTGACPNAHVAIRSCIACMKAPLGGRIPT